MVRRFIWAAAVILLGSGVGCAHTETGPINRPSYIELHGDLLRVFDGVDGPTGGSVAFGAFENKYLAAGTIIGYDTTGAGTGLPQALYIGGGFSVHIPIGQHLLLIPAVNLGYRITDEASSGFGAGIAAFGSLGAAYRLKWFYAGVEAQRPIYLELPILTSGFFPNITSAGAFVGAYF